MPLRYILPAVLWVPTCDTMRRSGPLSSLPSWSWAAWEGPITYSADSGIALSLCTWTNKCCIKLVTVRTTKGTQRLGGWKQASCCVPDFEVESVEGQNNDLACPSTTTLGLFPESQHGAALEFWADRTEGCRLSYSQTKRRKASALSELSTKGPDLYWMPGTTRALVSLSHQSYED